MGSVDGGEEVVHGKHVLEKMKGWLQFSGSGEGRGGAGAGAGGEGWGLGEWMMDALVRLAFSTYVLDLRDWAEVSRRRLRCYWR